MKTAKLKSLPRYIKERMQRKRTRAIVIALFVLLIALSIGVWFVLRPQPDSSSADTQGVLRHSTNEPSEVDPGNNYAWKGGPKDPKKVTISSAKVDGFVQKVGVDQNKQIAVPNNVFVGGWFVDSVRPGEKGLSIIDGHVNGRKQDGAIFQKLSSAKNGDKVVVEYGDGSKKSFTIFATHDVSLADAQGILFSQDPTVSQQLNLITCIGRFDKKANTYDKRFIVYAKLDT